MKKLLIVLFICGLCFAKDKEKLIPIPVCDLSLIIKEVYFPDEIVLWRYQDTVFEFKNDTLYQMTGYHAVSIKRDNLGKCNTIVYEKQDGVLKHQKNRSIMLLAISKKDSTYGIFNRATFSPIDAYLKLLDSDRYDTYGPIQRTFHGTKVPVAINTHKYCESGLVKLKILGSFRPLDFPEEMIKWCWE